RGVDAGGVHSLRGRQRRAVRRVLEPVALELHARDRGAHGEHHQDDHEHPGGEYRHRSTGIAHSIPEYAEQAAHQAAYRYWSTCTAWEHATVTGPLSPRTGPSPGTGTGTRPSTDTVPPGVAHGSWLQWRAITSPVGSPWSSRIISLWRAERS